MKDDEDIYICKDCKKSLKKCICRQKMKAKPNTSTGGQFMRTQIEYEGAK